MSRFRSRSGIVNVRMVITEEKMLSNIDKIQKLINPKSKKQIVQLEDDSYFKDLIESIKELLMATENKEKDWKDQIRKAQNVFSEDIIDTLIIVAKSKGQETENYQDAVKLLNARINNLETNLHIEIDMERIEDRSKALSYIGIEIADALKSIPTPIEEPEQEVDVVAEPQQAIVEQQQQQQYMQDTTFEAKPSLWQRVKNSKFVRAIKAITRIRIVLDYSDALPEGRGENNY